MKVKLGEIGTASFLAENRMDTESTGSAVFNVSPDVAGAYFNKIACFCFTEQTLRRRAGRAAGDLLRRSGDRQRSRLASNIDTITLSYTFFPATPVAPRSRCRGDGRRTLRSPL